MHNVHAPIEWHQKCTSTEIIVVQTQTQAHLFWPERIQMLHPTSTPQEAPPRLIQTDRPESSLCVICLRRRNTRRSSQILVLLLSAESTTHTHISCWAHKRVTFWLCVQVRCKQAMMFPIRIRRFIKMMLSSISSPTIALLHEQHSIDFKMIYKVWGSAIQDSKQKRKHTHIDRLALLQSKSGNYQTSKYGIWNGK